MDIPNIKTITQCNRLFGTPTLHPLVSVIHPTCSDLLSEAMRLGFYTLWLKEKTQRNISAFGWKECDFADGTLVALKPGTVAGRELWEDNYSQTRNLLLCFHSSLLEWTQKDCEEYTFLNYRENEALHLSLRERTTLEHEINALEEELNWGIDEYSYPIIGGRICLLLDYITHFYKRQFITRHDMGQEWVCQAEKWLDTFFKSGKAQHTALPTSETFAKHMNCSPAYFNDLMKCETGKDVNHYVCLKRISLAETMLKKGERSTEDIAVQLGFPTSDDFCTLFKKLGRKNILLLHQSIN